jgi:hypothetical protein
VEETNKMIIDTVTRLQLAVTDLRTIVVRRSVPRLLVDANATPISQNSASKEVQLAENEEFLQAKEILEVASA